MSVKVVRPKYLFKGCGLLIEMDLAGCQERESVKVDWNWTEWIGPSTIFFSRQIIVGIDLAWTDGKGVPKHFKNTDTYECMVLPLSLVLKDGQK